MHDLYFDSSEDEYLSGSESEYETSDDEEEMREPSIHLFPKNLICERIKFLSVNGCFSLCFMYDRRISCEWNHFRRTKDRSNESLINDYIDNYFFKKYWNHGLPRNLEDLDRLIETINLLYYKDYSEKYTKKELEIISLFYFEYSPLERPGNDDMKDMLRTVISEGLNGSAIPGYFKFEDFLRLEELYKSELKEIRKSARRERRSLEVQEEKEPEKST